MKKLTVSEWEDELNAALEFREIYGREAAWETLEMSYLNDPSGNTAVGPNLIYSEGDTLLSALIVPNPEFSVIALDKASMLSAPAVQSIANYFIKPEHLDLKDAVEGSLLNGYITPRAILKIGYDSEFGWDPTFDAGSVQNPWGMTFTQFNKKGQLIEFNNSKPGMPWVSSVNNSDFLVPWGTGDNVETAPWIAFRLIRETEYFKQDPKYKNTTDLQPSLTMEDYMNSYHHGKLKYKLRQTHRKTGADYSRRMFTEAWEIHDKRTGRIYVLSFDHDKFLRDVPDLIMGVLGSYPVVTKGFVRHPRCFWTTPLAYYLGQHQEDEHDLAIQRHKQRRINVIKFLYAAGHMDKDELDKIISGDVGAMAEVQLKSGSKISDVFAPFPKGSNIDLMVESELIRRDSREVIGHSRNQAGEFDASSRRTAREAVIVDRGSANRMTRKVDVTTYMYKEALRKSLLLIFSYWKRPREFPVGDKWMRLTGDQLKGRYAYNVDLVDRVVMSPAQRKFEVIQMMAMLSQFPNINLAALEQYLVDVSNDAGFEGFFTGLPQPAGMQGVAGNGSSAIGSSPPVLGPGVSNNSEGL